MVRNLFQLVASVLLAGCAAGETTSLDRFADDGRTIAFSGAEAGASNACFTCHGLDGQGNGAGSPRLAGLDAGYLQRQLEAYADGRRAHPQMEWIAQQLDARERKAVSTHYAALPPTISPARQGAPRQRLYHEGDPSRGLMACAACHGEQGQGLGPANPPLAGQPPAYLAEQLGQWRTAKRRNDPGDVMLRISQRLTPSESRLVADYAAGLSGAPLGPESAEAFREARRDDPRSDASGPRLHVPESARAAQ